MYTNLPRILLALLLTLLAATPIPGEAVPATLRGRVVDPTGSAILEAHVSLEPGHQSITTGAEGNFIISGLAPGVYTISISCGGFTTFTAPLTLAAGEEAHLDVVLQVATKNELIVVHLEGGEAAALALQSSSENIVAVIPEETIARLPNANLADAIGRLSGVTLDRDAGEGRYIQIRGTEPRLSDFTIDGVSTPSPEANVRQVKLDAIPAALVESIEVNKTLSANQDADAIGGSVNVKTRTAQDRPMFAINGFGGRTPLQGGRGVSQFGAIAGRRFGHEKRLGVLLSGTYDYNGRPIDDIETTPTAIANGNALTPAYTSMDLRSYTYDRKRMGFGGAIDYKLGESSSIYMRALYSDFKEYFDKSVYTLGDTIGANGAITGVAPKYSITGFRPDFAIGSLVVGGRHVFAGTWISWDVSASRSRALDAATNPKGDFKAIGALKNLTACKYDPAATTDSFRPQFSAACTADGASVFDASQYALKDIVTTDGVAAQLNLRASASLGHEYRLGSHSATFEVGGRVRNAHKFQDVANNTYLPAGGTQLLNGFLTTHTDRDFYDGSYTQGPFGDYGKLMAYFNANRNSFTLDSNATHLKSDPNNYGLVERVSAGYLMNTVEFGRFRLQTGVRFEGTESSVLGYHVTFDQSGNYTSTAPVRSNASYVDILPSVQLRFRAGANANIRAAWGQGIARPNPYDLVPYVNESDQGRTVAVGNPGLRAQHANNFDLLFERYLSSLGAIQAGVFYKDMSDPIYQFQTAVVAGPYAGYIQSQMANGTSAHVMGVEIGGQHYFKSRALRGAGIAANYTHTASAANHLPGRSDNPALLRQAPNAWNIGPAWDRGRVAIHAAWSYNGPAIYAYQYQDRGISGAPLPVLPLGGLTGPKGDQYYYAHLQVDAQGSVRLAHGMSAVAYGLNLTNEVFGYYNGSQDYVVHREYYGRTIAAGLRWSSSAER